MKRLSIIVASFAMFVITATAQASDTDVRVSPIASPLVTPVIAHIDKHVRANQVDNPWAYIWIWTR